MAFNRRIGTIGATTATLLIGAGALVAALDRDGAESPAAGPRPAYATVPPPSPGVLVNAGEFSGAPAPGPVRTATAPVTVRYPFDRGADHPVTDAAGGHELRALGQRGGALNLVPRGAGLALKFPARCTRPAERDCPRAILEGDRDDTLNPGTRPLTYGASILMTRADLGDGANVVQKGYSVGGVSQYKLQVDHRKGRPSCVLVGTRARIYRAEPKLDVADGAWHAVTCTRDQGRLTITVDGVPRASVPVPPTVSIANAEPLRIGGKGPNKGNDQYAGQLDDVFVTIA